ncbi:MAG: TldD/PmbA family protein [Elusimicrobia bacterium]|nr:TldD/PmbA family protein [Elusimicrobiota bacterium]
MSLALDADQLQAVGARTLDFLKKAAPDAQAEIYVSRVVDRGLELREGKLETLHESAEEGVGIRIIRGGRGGFAFCVGVESETIEAASRSLLEQLKFLPPDEHKVLPESAPVKIDDAIAGTLLDETLLDADADSRLERMRKLESDTLKADKRVKRVLRVGYGESRGAVSIVNTRGVSAFEQGTSCGVSVSAVAEGSGETQVGSAASSGRRFTDLDFDKIPSDAAFRTVALLDGKKLPTARRSIVFDPWVAPELLELIAGMLSADSVQRGRSLLAGKRGKRVGSDLATFVDDPLRRGGPASAFFDGEGVPTRRKVPIDGGCVRDYFYDAATAHKEGVESNGSAGRASYKSLAGPGSSNFYLEPGTLTREALFEDTKSGILVLELMGMHTADPVSGEFSVGLSGVEIKDGRLGSAVKGAMLSGNLLDLLDRLDAVADDLSFYGACASPTFRVRDLTVA